MAKRDKLPMPEIVFIGPPKSRAKFKHTVFIVLERDEDGIPTSLRMMKDADVVNVTEQSDFMTGYVPIHMTLPR